MPLKARIAVRKRMHCGAEPMVVASGTVRVDACWRRQRASSKAPRQKAAISRSTLQHERVLCKHAWRTCHNSARHSLIHSVR